MNRKIRGIKREIVDKKSKWMPIVIGAAGGYFLLLVWPSFAAGIGAGIAATVDYKAYYGPQREYRDIRPGSRRAVIGENMVKP